MHLEIDVWRAVQLLTTAEADGAEAEARQSLEHCRRGGVTDSEAFWRQVQAATRELRTVKARARAH